MKLQKIISVTICAAIASGMFTTVCGAVGDEISVTKSKASKQALTYDLEVSQDGTLISALYNSDGVLIKTESEAVTKGALQKTFAADETMTTGTTKFMLWNSVEGITPVSRFAEVAWDTTKKNVVKVMPLGDSITDGYTVSGGYRNTLESKIKSDGLNQYVDFVGSMKTGSGYDNDNEGHSGWAIAAIPSSDDIERKGRKGLATNIDSWMKTYTPDVVLLQIGTNDILSQYKLDEAQQRLESLVDKILAGIADDGSLYIATIPYIDVNGRYNATGIKDQAVLNAQVDTFNESVRAVALIKGLTLVDVNSALTLADLKDGTHPTSAGYVKLGELWYNSIIDELVTRIN